jgi:hypothetical protein
MNRTKGAVANNFLNVLVLIFALFVIGTLFYGSVVRGDDCLPGPIPKPCLQP